MPRMLYTVTASLPDEATARAYIAWLEDGHVDEVIRGGAHSAMIVRLEPDQQDAHGVVRVQTQYVFGTREVYDHYVERHAPALRAEGLKRFPPESGVRFERRLGVII